MFVSYYKLKTYYSKNPYHSTISVEYGIKSEKSHLTFQLKSSSPDISRIFLVQNSFKTLVWFVNYQFYFLFSWFCDGTYVGVTQQRNKEDFHFFITLSYRNDIFTVKIWIVRLAVLANIILSHTINLSSRICSFSPPKRGLRNELLSKYHNIQWYGSKSTGYILVESLKKISEDCNSCDQTKRNWPQI